MTEGMSRPVMRYCPHTTGGVSHRLATESAHHRAMRCAIAVVSTSGRVTTHQRSLALI